MGDKSHSLALFGTDIAEDPLAIQDLEREIRKHQDSAVLSGFSTYAVNSLDELLTVMATMDYVVTSRFHGIIFAHLLNKPVLAISPHSKVKTLMKDLDLAAYCLDVGECELNRLTDVFTALVSNADVIRSRMADRLGSYKSQLTVQFDQLFPSAVQ
jgi:polysaccharide pyruvyl transferase WcaK-like protein